MARFFPYDEVITRQLPSLKDVQWLAGQIARLEPFMAGSAVVCGSVSWGSHSSRSDIDIAHFATNDHPHIERSVDEVVAQYGERTNQRFIAPRIDVITIGVESESLVVTEKGSSSQGTVAADKVAGVSGGDLNDQPIATIFSETLVRFADHIGSLAHLKGDPWKEFHRRYLAANAGTRPYRREAIKSYVSTVTTAWDQQPLHPLGADADGQFTEQQLDLIGQAENYPVNLMRRILGEFERYPQPDRIPDVRNAFAKIDAPWSKRLLAHAEPFFAISAEYEKLVAGCRDPGQKPSAQHYHDRIRALFNDLPFSPIQETVWEYLES